MKKLKQIVYRILLALAPSDEEAQKENLIYGVWKSLDNE